MNRIILMSLLFLCFSSVAVAQKKDSKPSVDPNKTEWVILGKNLANPQKTKLKSGDPNLSVRPKLKPNLVVTGSAKQGVFRIKLWDGKTKFGDPKIMIRNGESIHMHARVTVALPLEQATAVTSKAPLKVVQFEHGNDKFEVNLVANSASKLPDIVLKKKK